MHGDVEGFELRIRLVKDGVLILGPGRADLLAGIAAIEPRAAAGRAMGMSYKRAWALVEAMNATFQAPLVEAAKGGAGGGGARLTVRGAQVLAAYRALQAGAARAGADALRTLDDVLAVSAPDKAL
jgi:molybdate transport system regulatory protein